MKLFTRKRIISYLITIGVLAMGVSVFQLLKKQKKSTVSNIYTPKSIQKVEWSTFEGNSVKNQIEIDGRIQAYERVSISSKVNGIMEEGSKHVKEGSFFREGELMFKVDDQEATYALLAQKAALMTSITQMMPDLKFDYPEAFSKWKSYLDNFDVEEAIQQLPELTSDQEKYYVSSRNIYNQYYNIKSAETRLRDYHIYAPFSGVTTTVNVYPGALVSPGANLATMINTTRFEMVAPVALEDLKYISSGQKVILCSTGLDQTWTGTITRVGSQIDPNTQNVPIYITVSGTGLKDGMYLKGTIEGGEIENVVTLPKNIFVNPSTVYVIQDSILVEKNIQSVKRLESSVLVRGVTPEDKIVTGSLAGLYDGQKVNY